MTVLLWIDTETTGPDTRCDHPLELGMRCTDTDPDPIDGGFSSPVRRQGHPDRLIRDMHTPNGLLEACAAAPAADDVPGRARDHVNAHSRDHILPAGATVRFDRNLLDSPAPDLLSRCDHRSLDAGPLDEAMKAWRPDLHAGRPKGRTDHRVDHCLDDTPALARYHRDALE